MYIIIKFPRLTSSSSWLHMCVCQQQPTSQLTDRQLRRRRQTDSQTNISWTMHEKYSHMDLYHTHTHTFLYIKRPIMYLLCAWYLWYKYVQGIDGNRGNFTKREKILIKTLYSSQENIKFEYTNFILFFFYFFSIRV